MFTTVMPRVATMNLVEIPFYFSPHPCARMPATQRWDLLHGPIHGQINDEANQLDPMFVSKCSALHLDRLSPAFRPTTPRFACSNDPPDRGNLSDVLIFFSLNFIILHCLHMLWELKAKNKAQNE